jgi:hypothetical protein
MYDGGNEDLNTATYCTTAWVSGSYALTYCPQATTITINLAEFQGLTRSRWYDPSGGVYLGISGSPFRNSGSHNFAMPGNNHDGNPNWLLVLDPAAGPRVRVEESAASRHSVLRRVCGAVTFWRF